MSPRHVEVSRLVDYGKPVMGFLAERLAVPQVVFCHSLDLI